VLLERLVQQVQQDQEALQAYKVIPVALQVQLVLLVQPVFLAQQDQLALQVQQDQPVQQV
jgi:hypothetical protein